MKAFAIFLFLVVFSITSQSQNNALHFDGVNDHVVVPAHSSYDIASGTIECLIKVDAFATASGTIMGVRGPGGSRYSFHILAHKILLWNGSNADDVLYAFATGQWYHLAFVLESNKTSFYVNGLFIGKVDYGVGPTTGQPLLIGAAQDNAPVTQFFSGQIDEVRIWNTVRTVEQLNANKDIELTGSESGLVALFNFDQGTPSGTNTAETTLAEQTSTHNNGTLVNFALTGNSSNYIAGIPNVGPESTLAWLLNGNDGTSPVYNFLGTKENRSLAFRTNNQEKMIILPNGFTGIGTSSPTSLLTMQSTKTSGGLVIKSPLDSEYPNNYISIAQRQAPTHGSEIFTYGRLDIHTGDQIYMTATNIFLNSNSIITRIGDPNSLATAKSSKTLALEANVWDSSQGQGRRTYAGIQNIASTTVNLSHRLAFTVNATTTDLANGIEGISVSSNGNVGIGIIEPKVKLAVDGNIKAKKLTITENPSWPDYVFDKFYKLPTLEHIEQFINTNRHLPGIPSEAEIKKNGMDVGENQALLLKKIEELTLYLIDQNKRIDRQLEMIKVLRNQVEESNKKAVKVVK